MSHVTRETDWLKTRRHRHTAKVKVPKSLCSVTTSVTEVHRNVTPLTPPPKKAQEQRIYLSALQLLHLCNRPLVTLFNFGPNSLHRHANLLDTSPHKRLPGATTAYMRRKNPLAGHKTCLSQRQKRKRYLDFVQKQVLRGRCSPQSSGRCLRCHGCRHVDTEVRGKRVTSWACAPLTASRHWSKGKCGRCLERTQPHSVNSTSSSSYPHYSTFLVFTL